MGLFKDKTETNILNEGIDKSDTSNRISETNIKNDEGSGGGRRSLHDINDEFENGRTAEKNVGISQETSNRNQQSSNIENKGNNRKQEVDDSASFNLSKDNTESKHNIISGLPTAQKQNTPSMAVIKNFQYINIYI